MSASLEISIDKFKSQLDSTSSIRVPDLILKSLKIDKDIVFELSEDGEVKLTHPLGVLPEQIVLEEVQDDDVRYWRDSQGVHHVPKRPLNDIIYPVAKEGSGSGIQV